ncbi:MAG TPA: diphosphomevalonate decarboxylase [Saprospiraceae bacterium]|nr:diphosphomevalonate decarboxylase [Saprospiraceae bacterium]HMQ85302.1 diphosphomevalonate decarboxylase [Saprospiraceae bacterium]
MASQIDYNNPKLILETGMLEAGEVAWRSPSNLAIVKYWGKHGQQLPKNPSISFTLEHAFTETSIAFEAKKTADQGLSLDFFFDGNPNEAFRVKVLQYLESLTGIFPFLKQLHLNIHSANSFPHSSGIASSASSMSALALCLCTMEDEFFSTLNNDDDFRQKASYVARLGSGSACRSIYEGLAAWGASADIEGASDYYAVPISEQVHEDFLNLQDAILLVSKAEKSVSSRAGHGLMENNPYAESRYTQARLHIHNLMAALKSGDLPAVGQIIEAEALCLHALMMASNPPYLLLEPNTLHIIEKVKAYRQDTSHPIYFSMDAGPNVHLFYPAYLQEEVNAFISQELSPFCLSGEWIADHVGQGPEQL